MRVAARDAAKLVDALEADAISAFEGTDPGAMLVEAFFLSRPDQNTIEATAARAGVKLHMLRIERLPEVDWVAKALEGRPPIRAGRFFICAPDDRALAPGGSYPLVVAATQGFGTGSHPSTRGCLLAIDALAKRHRFERALDLGCGAGVLGLAMARAWRKPVLGIDIDAGSVSCARENARVNGLGALACFIHGDGGRHAAMMAVAPFDVIAANILAGPLARLARPIALLLQPGGRLVLSGILAEQEAFVRAAYRAQGLALERRILLDGWATLVLGR
jgi:ribosomal protein L11 methyltransferase